MLVAGAGGVLAIRDGSRNPPMAGGSDTTTGTATTVEQLLGYSGLTVAELARDGETPTSPLKAGRALRISAN